MEELIAKCADDMLEAANSGTLSLDAQVRAYDLTDGLLALKEVGPLTWQEGSRMNEERMRFIEVFEIYKSKLEEAYCDETLKAEAAKLLEKHNADLLDASFAAAAAASLHEFTKETFEIYQNSGVFARRRALQALRERAGFKLESHRIGNYVAKTYDLMENARRAHQKAQQACFSANISYKIQPGLHARIASILTEE